MSTVPVPKATADAIRAAIEATRSDRQDGYPWMLDLAREHPMTVVLRLPPTAILELAHAVGLEPDPIEVNGTCATCLWSRVSDGSDRGWSFPCSSCAHPKMTFWEERPPDLCPGSGNSVAYRDDAAHRPSLRARAVRFPEGAVVGYECPHCSTIFPKNQVDQGGLARHRLLPHTRDGALVRTEAERQAASAAHYQKRRDEAP